MAERTYSLNGRFSFFSSFKRKVGRTPVYDTVTMTIKTGEDTGLSVTMGREDVEMLATHFKCLVRQFKDADRAEARARAKAERAAAPSP